IILDVLLQGEHSWELLQELKCSVPDKNTPVYVVTVIDNREKALALGAGGFHTKQVDRHWLMENLQNAAWNSAARKLLVIDDEEISRYLVRSVLGQTNFRIIEAATA